MSLDKDFRLDFTHFPKVSETIDYELGDSFFSQIDSSEILGGEVSLTITIVPLGTSRLELLFDYQGVVDVECDRCLQPISFDMDVNERVEVEIGDALNDENDEIITLNAQDPVYDFSWIAYELLALHLPIQRMHDIEDCDPEMVKYLTSEMPDEEIPVDPRWEDLKRQFDSKKINN